MYMYHVTCVHIHVHGRTFMYVVHVNVSCYGFSRCACIIYVLCYMLSYMIS